MPTLLGSSSRSPSPSPPGSQLTTIAMFVVVTAILYFARDVLIPLALAVLLSFLLAPAVHRLERLRLPRVAATTVMVGLSCCVIAGLVWISVNQFLNFAANLPEYKDNIQSKLSVFRTDPEGSLGKAKRTLEELSAEMAKKEAEAARAAERAASRTGRARAQPAPAMSVTVVEAPLTPFQLLQEMITPLVVPLTVAGAVILLTFVILLRREDLRDRLIRLVGRGHLNMTTQVFEEAAGKVSRYLRMQLIVNVTYGVPVGLALYAIGVPNAALWGLLAIALRFIPYLGAWIAAAMPIALAFAISEDWSLVLWTVAVFLVLELISNNVIEPWAYGTSTGMSAIAVITAAIFWTWLWGAVGLLLAVPLTVCLVVMGRYIPQLAFLSILLGDQPVLSIQERIYQRLLARDPEEAADLAEEYKAGNGLEALYEDVLIPVLDAAERDRHSDALSEERTRFVFDSMRELIEDISEPEKETNATGASTPPVIACIVPARDEADEVVGLMLLHRIQARGVGAELLSVDLLKSEVLDKVAASGVETVYVSALPPAAVLHTSFLCKRLRARFPDLRIVVALWHARGSMDRARDRLRTSGADEIVTTLNAAIEKLPAAVLVQATRAADAGPTASETPRPS